MKIYSALKCYEILEIKNIFFCKGKGAFNVFEYLALTSQIILLNILVVRKKNCMTDHDFTNLLPLKIIINFEF